MQRVFPRELAAGTCNNHSEVPQRQSHGARMAVAESRIQHGVTRTQLWPLCLCRLYKAMRLLSAITGPTIPRGDGQLGADNQPPFSTPVHVTPNSYRYYEDTPKHLGGCLQIAMCDAVAARAVESFRRFANKATNGGSSFSLVGK